MTCTKWLGACGVALMLAAGCAPSLRELGDEPIDVSMAGSGGAGVIPNGGSSQGGTMQGNLRHEGGAANEPSMSEGGATMVPDPSPSPGGASPSDGEAGCQTDDGIFASGDHDVPDPYSCNTCSCIDGVITNCTEINCPKACPENSMPALGCLDCVDGECRLSHYACFTSIYVDCNEYGCFAQSACADQLPEGQLPQ